MEAGLHPTSGLSGLDAALGDFYWGDNVVWLLDGTSPEPFYRSIARVEGVFDAVEWVTLTRDPDAIRAQYPGAAVIDGRLGHGLEQPAALIAAIGQRLDGRSRHLLLFESLDAMVERWGVDMAGRFFAACCPRLLALSAFAYWALDLRPQTAALRAVVERVTQCILRVDARCISVVKAEGRPDAVRGQLVGYAVEDGRARPIETPVGSRVGAALRAVRQARGLNQTELARLAGISPSAISQAERGERSLALETLLRLSAGLGMSLDQLLNTAAPSSYRIGRRADDPGSPATGSQRLLDVPESGQTVWLVRLAPRASGAPEAGQSGLAIVTVAAGLVQVKVDALTPALRAGEALATEAERVTGWRNLGDGEAVLFWTLRGPPAAH